MNSSLSRRRLMLGGLASGVGLLFAGCGGKSPLAPNEAMAKPINSGLARRLQVKQAVHVFSARPLTALQALQASGAPYEVVAMDGGRFVTSVNNAPDLWVFMVDGTMPDLSGASVVTRLGKKSVTSPHEISRFRAGTIGLSLATGSKSGFQPTAETEFAASLGQSQVLISWLQVGLLQPDTA